MYIWIYGPGPAKGYADAISARPYFCLKYGFLRIGCDVAVGNTKRPNEKCSTAAYYFNKLSYGFKYFHLNRKKGSYYFFYDIARKKKKKTEKEPIMLRENGKINLRFIGAKDELLAVWFCVQKYADTWLRYIMVIKKGRQNGFILSNRLIISYLLCLNMSKKTGKHIEYPIYLTNWDKKEFEKFLKLLRP